MTQRATHGKVWLLAANERKGARWARRFPGGLVADAPDAIFRLAATPGDRLVLVLLWRYASAGDPSPVVWPSAERLAGLTGFAERAVRRSLATLAALGAISRCQRPASAMAKGKAWRLHPDPPVPLTRRSPDPPVTVAVTERSPGPSGHPDPLVPPYPDPPVLNTLTGGSPRSPIEAPSEASASTDQPRDPRLVLADAINAQAEHAEAVGRANPPTRMGASTSASGEHQALRQRFQAALSKLEPGPERARLAACGLATPMPEVLRQASDELGGLERVADVLGWAWAEVAAGRLTSFGRAEASTALRDAFRGEGRYWRGILDAYSRRPGEQRALAWRPPDLGDLEPATLDELRMPDWRAAR